MGLKLYPGSIKEQADSIIQNLESDNKDLLSALQTISQFVQNTELKGAAWESMKYQLGNHEAVIQGFICGNDSVIQEHENLKSSVGDENLDEDELIAKRDSLMSTNAFLEKNISLMQSNMQNDVMKIKYGFWYQEMIFQYQISINQNQTLIDELNEKIQKLYDIENTTASLFSQAGALYEAITDGILTVQKSWNSSTGEFTVTNVNMEWKKKIEKSWEEREEREIKKIQEKLEQDYKEGKIDYDTYISINSGLLNSGMAYVREVGISKLQDAGADAIANAVVSWFRDNTYLFSDPELALETVMGDVVTKTKAPSALVSSIRTGTKYIAPLIGTFLDYSFQRIQGEDQKAALDKAMVHTVITTGTMAGMTLVLGTTPVGWAAVGVLALGTAGCMAFDYVYDNWDEITEQAGEIINDAVETVEDIGNAVTGWFSDVVSIFD